MLTWHADSPLDLIPADRANTRLDNQCHLQQYRQYRPARVAHVKMDSVYNKLWKTVAGLRMKMSVAATANLSCCSTVWLILRKETHESCVGAYIVLGGAVSISELAAIATSKLAFCTSCYWVNSWLTSCMTAACTLALPQ